MSRSTLSNEIRKELGQLNDRIDRKIIKGQPFHKEARRHKELLATLRCIDEESVMAAPKIRKGFRRVKSPVRRSLARGVVGRVFGFRLA